MPESWTLAQWLKQGKGRPHEGRAVEMQALAMLCFCEGLAVGVAETRRIDARPVALWETA